MSMGNFFFLRFGEDGPRFEPVVGQLFVWDILIVMRY